MELQQTVLLIVMLVWNLTVFAIYGADKLMAIKGMRRVPEKNLLGCAFFAGGVGALAGMFTFRHKTRHTKFRVLLPIAAVLTVALAVFVVR